MELWYFVRAKCSADVETAPIYHVKVGTSRRAQSAHADLCARSLQSDEFFYCRRSLDSSKFVHRLLVQNPEREIYEVTAVQMRQLLTLTANVVNVKNLSQIYQHNLRQSLCLIRGSKILQHL